MEEIHSSETSLDFYGTTRPYTLGRKIQKRALSYYGFVKDSVNKHRVSVSATVAHTYAVVWCKEN
jgi:hypothetical protein